MLLFLHQGSDKCVEMKTKKKNSFQLLRMKKIEEFQTYTLSKLSSKIRIQRTLCTATRRYKEISSEINKWRLIEVFYSLSRNKSKEEYKS